MEEEIMEPNIIDQQLVNSIAMLEELPAGSDERKQICEEIRILANARNEDMKTQLEFNKHEDTLELEKARIQEETDARKEITEKNVFDNFCRYGFPVLLTVGTGTAMTFITMVFENNYGRMMNKKGIDFATKLIGKFM